MQRHKIASRSALAEGMTKLRIGESEIILIRDGSALSAFAATCPHAGAPLDQGALCRGRLICPWHKAEFDVTSGALLEPPALNDLQRFEVSVEGDDVLISDSHDAVSPARADRRHVVVLGTGAAATACITELRHRGFAGAITAVGPEPGLPYDRTALSKFVLSGDMRPDDVPPLREPDDWHALTVEQRQASVRSLDPGARHVILDDGATIPYDALVIATGARAKRPSIPGIGLPSVLTLRSREDAARVTALAKDRARIVILGASFIGLEAASAFRERGLQVTVVSPEPLPFAKQFGKQAGAMFKRLHEQQGVAFCLGDQADAVEAGKQGVIVRTKAGALLPADLVLVGAGVEPATEFASALALSDDRGIIVDASMRARDDIHAIGDCATFPLDERTVRIEHWRVAQQHGRVAARAILGEDARYDGVPFFWTYHYGRRYEYLGHPDGWDSVHIDGRLDSSDFVILQLRGANVVGVLACGRETATARLIVRMREQLTLHKALACLNAPRVAA